MATLSDSVKAQLDADWTGAGGAEPTYYVEEDLRTNPPSGQDYIFIMTSTHATDSKPFNDKYVTDMNELTIVTNTLTSEDRLKEISDEVVRILDATAVAGVTYQRRKRRKITSGVDKGVFNYQEEIVYDLREQMKSGAAAYGTGTTGDFAVVGDLSVGGDSVLDGDLTVKGSDADDYLEFTTTSNETILTRVGGRYIFIESDDGAYTGFQINDDGVNYCMLRYNKAAHQMEYYTPQTHIFAGGNVQIDTALTDATDTMTIAQMADLMMFGSANAAWVPCSVFAIDDFADATFSGGALSNVGANDYLAAVKIPLPVAKGSLKLYITGYRFIIFDADATNKVTASYLYGFDSDGANTLITSDGTDYDAQGTHTKSFSAEDCSGHSGLFIYYTTDVADANALDIKGIQVQCYYDT